MSMPEATMNEDYKPMPRKHEVRRAAQIAPMKAKPEAERVRGLPDAQLRGGVA